MSYQNVIFTLTKPTYYKIKIILKIKLLFNLNA